MLERQIQERALVPVEGAVESRIDGFDRGGKRLGVARESARRVAKGVTRELIAAAGCGQALRRPRIAIPGIAPPIADSDGDSKPGANRRVERGILRNHSPRGEWGSGPNQKSRIARASGATCFGIVALAGGARLRLRPSRPSRTLRIPRSASPLSFGRGVIPCGVAIDGVARGDVAVARDALSTDRRCASRFRGSTRAGPTRAGSSG